MSEVRYPRLLTPSGGEWERLNPSHLSVTMSLWPLSTARMSLPEGEPTVRVRDLVEIFGPDGSLGYFRVSAVAQRVGDTQEVDLEHSVAVLDDDITAKDQTLTGTMTAILKQILDWQTVKNWSLGEVECKKSGLSLKVDQETLRDAVVACVKLVDDYGLFFEQTGDKWLLHVRKLPTEPSCEVRLTRNAAGVEIKIDDQELCTRVVDEALPGGELRVPTTEWGVVTRTLNIPAGSSEGEAVRYAEAYLKEHSVPNLSIEIEAVTLAEHTGEAWDKFTNGAMCRAVLAEYGIVQSQRIITMDWPNVLINPRKVYLTMSKPERRIEEVVARNRSGGGGAAKQANEAEKNIAIVGDTIGLFANSLDGALVRLDKAEAEIILRVKKGEVINEINMDESGITIKANKVNLVGYVTASQLAAWGGSISATELYGDIVKTASLWLNGTHVVTRNVQGTDGNTYRALVLSTSGN